MNRYIKLIPVSAVLAFALSNVLAQATAPAGAASAPSTMGVSPQEAAEANRKAVPRSDTGTVVRTAPSPAARASGALNGNSGSTATTNSAATPSSSGAATDSAQSSTGMASGSGSGTGTGTGTSTRRARADRN